MCMDEYLSLLLFMYSSVVGNYFFVALIFMLFVLYLLVFFYVVNVTGDQSISFTAGPSLPLMFGGVW